MRAIFIVLALFFAAPAAAQDVINPQTNASALTTGTVAAARGGAGAVNGVLSANGSGAVAQGATSGLSDVTVPTAWSPTDASGASLVFTGVTGTYTKIGNMIFASAQLTYPTTANGSNASINLPVASANANYGTILCAPVYEGATTIFYGLVAQNTTHLNFKLANGTNVTNANLSTLTINVSCAYPAS